MIEELKGEDPRQTDATEGIGTLIEDVTIETMTDVEMDGMIEDIAVHQRTVVVDLEVVVEETKRRMKANMSGADEMVKKMPMKSQKKRRSLTLDCLEN